ncbi:uncharacterized protein LOC121384677 [Gigantopelta aegis]|uniref:uncharacterized protein LOC121384677 n=1 Tax=Gigantopelta aegis TaxID=1735272 RepID=UPI001B88C27D|nr:uncharacterized protein LOC121384677 [Gigantopelta aegis]
MLYLLTIASLVSFGVCVPNNQIGDSVEARNLFHKADLNKDQHIHMDEFIKIFMDFDENGDGVVTTPEFVGEWTFRELGPANEAVVLFYNIDVNKDGKLTRDNDLTFIFNYFDMDFNHELTEAEFVVQWIKLSLA